MLARGKMPNSRSSEEESSFSFKTPSTRERRIECCDVISSVRCLNKDPLESDILKALLAVFSTSLSLVFINWQWPSSYMISEGSSRRRSRRCATSSITLCISGPSRSLENSSKSLETQENKVRSSVTDTTIKAGMLVSVITTILGNTKPIIHFRDGFCSYNSVSAQHFRQI